MRNQSGIDLSSVPPGFTDPVMDAQACYRALLEGLARPGTVKELRKPVGKLAALQPAAASIALTLFDADTSVWLSPKCRTHDAVSFLKFHTGCNIVDEPGAADFAVTAGISDLPPLGVLRKGSVEYPDQSATVIVQVQQLDDSAAVATARGPGIKECQELRVSGMGETFIEGWRENRSGFPRGVDIFFVSGDAVVGLPRSTTLELA